MKLTETASSLMGIGKDNLSEVNAGLGNIQDLNINQKNNNDSFSSILKESLNEVNSAQLTAYDSMKDIATGKVENLQEAVKKIESAELSLKLGLEVKNKALGAYKQIMAMQI